LTAELISIEEGRIMDNGMTPKERWYAAMAQKELDRPSVGVMTQSATVDQMEAIGVYWPDAHDDPELMAKLGMAQNTVLGFEAARIPFGLTIEAENLGLPVDRGKVDRTPMVKGHPYKEDNINELEIPKDFVDKGRAKVVRDAVGIMKKEVGDKLPIVVGTTGPFTLAGHLVGTENLLLWIVTQPEKVHELMKFTAEVCYEYQKAVNATGCDAIQQSDPSASTDMLSGEMFDEYAAPYIKRSFEGVDNAKTVLHICGDTTILLDHMINTGTTALSIEEKVDPFEAVKLVDGRAALVGNIGVVNPLLQGTPEITKEHTQAVCEAGFNVVSPGCGLAARVGKDNLIALVETVKAFKK
jgi:[methyl-Co(III) methanol-specific corrinoid protein]:coenzyme M methyltransferase